MQTTLVDRDCYIELMMNADSRNRIFQNIAYLIEKCGLLRESYIDQLDAFSAFTGLEPVYAEQAMHGHPVYRTVAPLCDKFQVTFEAMIFEDLRKVMP